MALSAALNELGIALQTGMNSESLSLPQKMPLAQLNARHRHELLVNALMKGVHVDESTGEVSYGAERARFDTSAYDSAFWSNQLNQLHAMIPSREERLGEITLQQTDILSFLSLGLRLNPRTHMWTMLLLSVIHEAASRIEFRVKHHFSLARPVDLDPTISPIIQTPAHSTFPSGHATEAFCLAEVLARLFGPEVGRLSRLIAVRIAENRCYAGVHFPVDNEAGMYLGQRLARIFCQQLFGSTAGMVDPGMAIAVPKNVPETDVKEQSSEQDQTPKETSPPKEDDKATQPDEMVKSIAQRVHEQNAAVDSSADVSITQPSDELLKWLVESVNQELPGKLSVKE